MLGGGDQEGVGRIDDDGARHSQEHHRASGGGGDEGPVGVEGPDLRARGGVGRPVSVVAVVEHSGTGGRPLGARRDEVGQGVESADVVPAHGDRHGGHSPGCGHRLGDGVVDGDLLQGGPALGQDLLALGGVPDGGDGLDALGQLGSELGEVVQEDAGADHEHAGVPAVVAGGQVGGGGVGVGLLGEAQDPTSVGGPGHVGGVAGVDVAEGGRGAGGLDPDGDHPALLGQAGGLADSVGEGGPVGHGVVGGEGADDGVSSVSVGDDGGGQANGRHGVARGGLSQEVVARDARELVGHGGDVGDAGDDRRRRGHRGQSLNGVLQKAAAGPGEVEEELGAPAPAERPQPGARTACGNDGVNGRRRPVGLYGAIGRARVARNLSHRHRLALGPQPRTHHRPSFSIYIPGRETFFR